MIASLQRHGAEAAANGHRIAQASASRDSRCTVHSGGLPARARIRQAGCTVQGILIILSGMRRNVGLPIASRPAARARFAAHRAADRPTSRAAPRPKRSCGFPDQQCHGKGSRTTQPASPRAARTRPVKQLRHDTARQGQSRIAPLSRQRHGEARHDRNEILAAAKRQQPS